MGLPSSYLGALLRLPVQNNMKTDPPTASPHDPASKVVELMIRENVGAVIVLDDKEPVGIITEKDILERIIKPERSLESTLVEDIMSQPLITIEAERPIIEALGIMRDNRIRRLVITENGVLVGLTTERRLLEVAHERYMMQNFDKVKRALVEDFVKPTVAFVSTYPPRECGIATYTGDLVDALSQLYVLGPPIIAAINDRGGYYDYSNLVKYQINRDEVESYEKAAEYINESDVDVVNLQHEYGLFGGEWGDYIIAFLERLEKPIVTTLHTVMGDPAPYAKNVLKSILQYSDYAVVMARVGMALLEQLYDTLADRVRYIPHGCPNLPFIDSETVKPTLGLKDRIVLSTFGLLNRGKGIEYAIKAIPQIVEEYPGVLYLVIGETHPEVRKQEGETYRQSLFELVDSLGIEENIRFVNRFLEKSELIRYLRATDIYVLPSPNREQISSGTLSYALSTGKAIVTTPFLHAEEFVSEGGAMGCEFRDPSSIAECVTELLRFDGILEGYEKKAYECSRDMIWPIVAMKYANLYYQALEGETYALSLIA